MVVPKFFTHLHWATAVNSVIFYKIFGEHVSFYGATDTQRTVIRSSKQGYQSLSVQSCLHLAEVYMI